MDTAITDTTISTQLTNAGYTGSLDIDSLTKSLASNFCGITITYSTRLNIWQAQLPNGIVGEGATPDEALTNLYLLQ